MNNKSFWNVSKENILADLTANEKGLSYDEAKNRLKTCGANLSNSKSKNSVIVLFLNQFKSPIILLLMLAAGFSIYLQDVMDAVIILVIIFLSAILSFIQEYSAVNAVAKLIDSVKTRVTVLRDNAKAQVLVEEIVPGDIVLLSGGDIIPGDAYILESNGLYADESVFTGETYPAAKTVGVLDADTPLDKRSNSLFMGTHVVSGSGRAIVVMTGKGTELGKISERLASKTPHTDFENGIQKFGYMLMEITFFLIFAVFIINVFLKRPILDALLFALALAVGLTPQLLPAIISINIAKGAKNIAKKKVIVKKLNSIENFGSMNVLCSDKTGTLTEGSVNLFDSFNPYGEKSNRVFEMGYLNAYFETGFKNPIDNSILSFKEIDSSRYEKINEIPYDFTRKRLSVILKDKNDVQRIIISKGAFSNIISTCTGVLNSDNQKIEEIEKCKDKVDEVFNSFGDKGYRVLGVAFKKFGQDSVIDNNIEKEMVFAGFLVFCDPVKKDIVESVNRLSELGVSLKIITGDNKIAAGYIARQIGVKEPKVMTGVEVSSLEWNILWKRVSTIDVFAEVDPSQKERIILALKKAGNVVGYMGDGINDAPALHAADVGISVDTAVGVAKEAANIVLLEKNFDVLAEGILEGRRTFANTMKYIFMAVSANFGNMFSMVGASIFLPFIPLLPKQILLLNFMTDFPEMAIAFDNVDSESIMKPRKWDIGLIKRFMLVFGVLSSTFDFITFGVLLLMGASEQVFHTGWFLESVISATSIVMVLRTRRSILKSKPAGIMMLATLIIIAFVLILPFTSAGSIFGLVPLNLKYIATIIGIVILYVISGEFAKKMFYGYIDKNR